MSNYPLVSQKEGDSCLYCIKSSPSVAESQQPEAHKLKHTRGITYDGNAPWIKNQNIYETNYFLIKRVDVPAA